MLNDCMNNHEMLKQIEDGTYRLGEGIITIGSYKQVPVRYQLFKTENEFPKTLKDISTRPSYDFDEIGSLVVIYEGYNEGMVFRYNGKKWNLCGKFDGCKEYL